jgi:cyanophycin synthetase
MLEIVQIKRVFDIPGVTPGMLQPSMAVLLEVKSTPPPEDYLSALDAIFGTLAANYAKPTEFKRDPVIDRIAAIIGLLLERANMPVFSPILTSQLSAQRYNLQIPTITGCYKWTYSLLIRVVDLINGISSESEPDALTTEVARSLKELRKHAPKGKNTLPILEAADKAQIPWQRVYGNVYQLGQGRRARWMDSSFTDRTSIISAKLAQDKVASTSLLRRLGFPVPQNRLIQSDEEAGAFVREYGYPVVIKPANKDGGVGVTAAIRNEAGLLKALGHARKHGDSILIEKHVAGNDHRIHVFEGEAYRVRRRVHGGVTGDGRSTVRELLQALNADPQRGPRGSNAARTRIDLDDEALSLLAEQGLTADSVPEAKRFVQLRSIANVTTGGETLPVPMEKVHPDNILLATRAVRALKLDLAAVDLLIPDISRSWQDVGAAICEINAKPQFGPDAPPWILERMFPQKGRIPIVAVVGEPSDDAWIEEAGQTVKAGGKVMGLCSPQGASVHDVPLPSSIKHLYYQGASMVLDSSVDCLLIKADASLLASGLPVDIIDLLVLTSPLEGEGNERLARVLSYNSLRVLIDDTEPRLTGIGERLKCPNYAAASIELIARAVISILLGETMQVSQLQQGRSQPG